MKIAMIGSGYVGLVSGVCFDDFKRPDRIVVGASNARARKSLRIGENGAPSLDRSPS